MKNKSSNGISRRTFITKLWGFAVAMPFLYGAFKFVFPPKKPFISSYQKSSGNNVSTSGLPLESIPVNSSKMININGEPIIIIRRSESDIIALSAVCTHLNCVVGFRKENNDIYCACHGGRYDLSGNPIEGPPKEPLAKYRVAIENNKIIVSGNV